MSDPKNLDCLLPKTKTVLLELIESCHFLKKYVFVGGSALSLYLCHRQSEDLDFFTYSDNFDKEEILHFIKRFDNREIVNQSNEQIDILIDGVKVTFFNAKWEFLRPTKQEQFNLASIEVLGGMKVHTLFLRAKYRDYYDLYYLVKEGGISVRQLFEQSMPIVEGMNFKLFAIALIYIDDIEEEMIDYLTPKIKISKEEIRDFFQKRLNRI